MIGTNRFFTIGPIEPNYSAYFNIPSLNYNYLPIATNWEHYVARNLFPDITKTTGVIFWPAWYPGNTTQTILNRIHAYEKVGVRYLITDSGQSLVPSATIPAGKASNTPLPLLAGQSAEVAFAVPTGWKSKESVNGVGIFQGNYGNTANGNLAIKICSAAHGCVAGSRPLSESRDNSVFSIPLAHSLRVEPGEALTVTLSHVGGNRPEALWLWPQAPGYAQRTTGPQGPLSGKALQLSLEYGGTTTGVRKVYSGALMNIWELPHPAPYYTILHGDCSLTEQTRETVVAQCHTPSTLLRRELYMPGWSATVNGSNMAVSAHEEIFQTVPLGAGKNMVRFHFAPPYVDYAWIAFVLGLAGLLWQSVRKQETKPHEE